jgi:uncharacterized membrane protein HdeD (DUF308 family)
MRVVRQILVGLGLIVLGVGAIVTIQGIVILTQPTGNQSASVEAIAVTIFGALLLIGGVILLVKGIRKRAVVASENAA